MCKIIIARIATPAELGKLNTFVALLESLIPLAFVPLFDQLWKLSLLSYPGLNFLITAGILGVIFPHSSLLFTIGTKDVHSFKAKLTELVIIEHSQNQIVSICVIVHKHFGSIIKEIE